MYFRAYRIFEENGSSAGRIVSSANIVFFGRHMLKASSLVKVQLRGIIYVKGVK